MSTLDTDPRNLAYWKARAAAGKAIPTTTQLPFAPAVAFEPLSLPYIQRAASFASTSGVILDTSIEHLSRANYQGRGENANPFYYPQIADATFALAQSLGLTAQDAYDSAAHVANAHFNTFGQFYTEASSPEIISDEINKQLFAKAGRASDYAGLNDAQRASAASRAQGIQDALKEQDSRDAKRWTIGAIEKTGAFVASWFGYGTVASVGNIVANKSIGLPSTPTQIPVETLFAAPVAALNRTYGAADANIIGTLQPGESFLDANTHATIGVDTREAPAPSSISVYIAILAMLAILFIFIVRR